MKKKDETIMELQNKTRDLKKLVVAHQNEAELKQQQLLAKVRLLGNRWLSVMP